MKMVDFLFVYEHVNREIENYVLVMEELCKRGYNCELVSFYGPDYVKRRLLRHKAKVVVTPWLRFDEDLYRFLVIASNPYKIVDAQCEQVSSDMSASGNKVLSDICKKALFFCWGEERKRELMDDGIEEENLFVTGAIQLDYGRKEFDDYFFSRGHIANKYNLNKAKRWILFVSSFSIIEWSDDDVDKACDAYGKQIRENYKMNQRTQKLLLEWIDRFCSENDCEFIYRPHPSETNTENLKAISWKYECFHIISDYSVKQWGKVCNSVNLWISTSNAELFSIGVDYNVVRPYPVSKEYDIHTFIGDEFVTTYDQFEQYVLGKKSQASDRTSIRREIFQKYYSYNEKIPSYKRFADALVAVLERKELSFDIDIPIALRKQGRNIFLKDIIKSVIIFANSKFPKFRIVETVPMPKGTRDLLRIRCENYSNKMKAFHRMKHYISEKNKKGESI